MGEEAGEGSAECFRSADGVEGVQEIIMRLGIRPESSAVLPAGSMAIS